MDISAEIRTRIVAAAEQLYTEADSERFPTVDQVRRAARTDMNSTSTVMKEWRRQQTAAPAAVAVPIPDRVRDAAMSAAAVMWSESQELANESLDVAKQAWEIERADADAMRAELAEAYEQQAGELEALQQLLTETQASYEVAKEKQQQQAVELAAVTAKFVDAEGKEKTAQQRLGELRSELAQSRVDAADQARQQKLEVESIRKKSEQQAEDYRKRFSEIEQQKNDLTNDLTAVKTRAESQKSAAEQQQQAATVQSDKLSGDIKSAIEKADKLASELKAANESAAQARENAAELIGKLEATVGQNKELMAILEKLHADREGVKK
jgi:chromosome segregation ATPase